MYYNKIKYYCLRHKPSQRGKMEKNISANYTKEEEREHFREEKLKNDSPGLFSRSPIWFRHSDYEIIPDNRRNFYIAPKHNTRFEIYKPFEKYPEILEEFITMILEIRSLSSFGKNQKKAEEIHLKKSHILREFVKKYGLFGLFWEQIQRIDEPTGEGKKVYLDMTNIPNTLSYFDGYPVDYDEYSKAFFPKLERPYPDIDKDTNTFLNNYAEPVGHIFANGKFSRLGFYIEKWKKFEQSNSKLSDIEDPEIGVTWQDTLTGLSIGGLGLTLSCSNNNLGLEWRFKSLIGALTIMHLMNFTGTMGKKIQVCHLEGCNKIARRKYCSDEHEHSARQNRYIENLERKRKKNPGD